jgi:hypothetical protein
MRLDGNVAASVTGGNEPFEYTRHFVDLDASFIISIRALGLVAARNADDRRSDCSRKPPTGRFVRRSVAPGSRGIVRLQRPLRA